ncbi:MAG: sulfotransferase [Nocardioides sp.]
MSDSDHPPAIPGDRLVFVGGLHRSGTTPLSRALAAHPEVSGLTGTGVPEDEGQHLQDVYPRLRTLGGMGTFARNPRAHLTDSSELVSPENAARLLASLTPYWDLDRRLLLEKSPANLVMGRFLQALFPGSALVVVVRNPVVSALALEKWNPLLVARNGRRRTTLVGRVENWARAHETLRDDLPHLRRVHVLRYEDLVSRPDEELACIAALLGLSTPVDGSSISSGRSDTYAERWAAMATGSPWRRRIRRRIVASYADDMLAFGYDPETLAADPLWRPPMTQTHPDA